MTIFLDAISMKLREVCPALYNQEDALSSKAQEILIKARNQTNQREKDQMIQEAITICKEVRDCQVEFRNTGKKNS